MYDYVRNGFGEEYLYIEYEDDIPKSNIIHNKEFITRPTKFPAFFVSAERNQFWHKVSRNAFMAYLNEDVDIMRDKIMDIQQFIIDVSILLPTEVEIVEE